MTSRRAVRFALLLFALPLLRSTTASAATPTVELDRTTVAPGQEVTVSLIDWPVGTVNLTVCGNNALRGDQDCSLPGTAAVANDGGRVRFDFLVPSPPVPCPCVLRAFNAGNATVRTTVIDLEGVESAPTVAPSAPSAPSVQIAAEVAAARTGGVGNLRGALGGRTSRVLQLTITNAGALPLLEPSLTAAVGRPGQGGEPLDVPVIEPLAAGASATYQIPFTLSAPVWGSYRVSGVIYGGGQPASFAVTTSASPTLLVLVVVVLLSGVTTLVVLRGRRRARIRRVLRQHRAELDARRTVGERVRIDSGYEI